MTPKEKAAALVEKYKEYVHGYAGSSMLTNHEYPEQILSQAKKAALIAVDEILAILRGLQRQEYCRFVGKFTYKGEEHEHIMTGYDMADYYNEVKTELTNL